MRFNLISNKLNPLTAMRLAGYHPDRFGKSYIRRLSGGDFPRFHVYLKESPGALELNLHLDQKGACYQGSTAHSGDYDGDVLEAEGARIKIILEKK
jgi:hypothetical protein